MGPVEAHPPDPSPGRGQGDGAGLDAGLDADLDADLVAAIHATPQRLVMAFAGAGAEALARLHAVGGSSRTVLEAVDVYAARSMAEWVGFTPAHTTTRRVAAAMADAAWRRARELVAGEEGPAAVFGVGVTAAIATDRVKKGEHRVLVAVRDGFGTLTSTLTLQKGARDRAGEEAVVTQLVLRAVADACGVLSAPEPALLAGERLETALAPSELLGELAAQEQPFVVVRTDGTLASELPAAARLPSGGAVILSGAFNPLHAGHRELARVGAQQARQGQPAAGGAVTPVFELPLVNADKSAIDLAEARRRAQQLVGREAAVLTRAPLFVDKARLFPGSVFVIGADTAERIVEPRFYQGDPAETTRALERVRAAGCRFLVAGRQVAGRMLTLADVAVPAGFEGLFEPVPEAAFRSDLSSTAIRESWANGPD